MNKYVNSGANEFFPFQFITPVTMKYRECTKHKPNQIIFLHREFIASRNFKPCILGSLWKFARLSKLETGYKCPFQNKNMMKVLLFRFKNAQMEKF